MPTEPADGYDRASQRCEAKAERVRTIMADHYRPHPEPGTVPNPQEQAAQLIEDLHHFVDLSRIDLDYAWAQARRRYGAEVDRESTEIETGLGIEPHRCRRCSNRVDEALRWHQVCPRCQGTETPRWRTWTVIIAGPERYDGEAPYAYLVMAHSSTEATLRAQLAHVIDQETNDLIVMSVNVGAPDPLASINDHRDRADLDDGHDA